MGNFSNHKHVGNIKIFEIDFKKKIARLGILIGEKKYRNLGLGSEVIDAVKKFLIKKNFIFVVRSRKKKYCCNQFI